MLDDFVFRIVAAIDEETVVLEFTVLLLAMYGQAVSGVGGIAVDAAQSDAHGRVFVVVFFAVGRVHNDVTTLRCVHMVFLVVIPNVAVLRWTNSPGSI